MSLHLARSGRDKALRMRKANRKLVSPAHHLDEVILPRQGSLDAGVLMMLHRGVSAETLSAKSGWSRSDVMVQIFQVVKRARLGLERRDGMLYLIYPEADLGSSCDARTLREAVQARRADQVRMPFPATNPKAGMTMAV